MKSNHHETTATQLVALSPITANTIAKVLNQFAERMAAPHLRCDPQNIQESHLKWITTLASLMAGIPDEEACGGN